MNMRCFSRRETLGLVLGAVITPALSSSALASSLPKRKNIDLIPDDELKLYVDAVGELVKRSKANPAAQNGYDWQAGLHNNFLRVRGDGCEGACEHRSELFFPWHRAHLAGFEKLLRDIDPPRTASITIPYWDWSKPASGVRFPKAFEDAGSWLHHAGRDHDVTPSTPSILWDPEDIKTLVQDGDWNDFAGNHQTPAGPGACPHFSGGSFGSVEFGPHNAIHGLIGSTMGDPESASQDPIYWSFHAFIDLIWARWQRVHTSATKPQPFTDPGAKIWVEPFVPVVSDMAQTFSLPTGYAYEYDYDFSIDASALIVSVSDRSETPLAAVAAGPQTMTAAPVRAQKGRRHFLRLRNLVIPRDVSYVMRAYVHPVSVQLAPLSDAERQRYLAASGYVWAGHSHGPADAHLDLTKAIAKIAGEPFAISIVTEPYPPAPTPATLEAGRGKLKSLNKSTGALWGSLVLETR